MTKRVLVVDDDDPIRRMVSTVLAREGFVVEACADTAAAAREITRERYDAVVLALTQNDIAGHANVLALLDVGRSMPYVVLTSAGSQGMLDAAESRVIAARLRKPFDIGELVSAVRSCVSELPE